MQASGTLFIVATPIGNLDDITHRAVNVLRTADIVAAEDTRHSQKLLKHYHIQTRMLSLHEHNEAQRIDSVIEKLSQGMSIALISDAGTPLISDPGYVIVNACRQAGVSVVPIPGPCAAVTALCASGLATDKFTFEGFLPVKQQAKLQAISSLEKSESTGIFYESPRRILDTLIVVEQALGENRQVVIAKELTKTFETFFNGTAQEAIGWLKGDENRQKGEFVLMISAAEKQSNEIPADAEALLKSLLKELPTKKAAAITAEHFGLKKNTLYQLALSWQ